jgi:hypothetical protein
MWAWDICGYEPVDWLTWSESNYYAFASYYDRIYLCFSKFFIVEDLLTGIQDYRKTLEFSYKKPFKKMKTHIFLLISPSPTHLCVGYYFL